MSRETLETLATRASNVNAQTLSAWLTARTAEIHEPVTRSLIENLLKLHGRNATTHGRNVGDPEKSEDVWVYEYACGTCTKDDSRWRLTSEWDVADAVVWPCHTIREVIRFLEHTQSTTITASLADVASEAVRKAKQEKAKQTQDATA